MAKRAAPKQTKKVLTPKARPGKAARAKPAKASPSAKAAPRVGPKAAPKAAKKQATKEAKKPVAGGGRTSARTPSGKGAPRAVKSATTAGARRAPGSGVRPSSARRTRQPEAPIVLPTEVIVLPDMPADAGAPASRTAEGVVAAAGAGVGEPGGAGGAREFALGAARLCRDDHCEEVVLIDVREVSSVADYIIIGSGTSDRQMRSVLRHVEELGRSVGSPAVRTSSDERATWLIADFVDVVVHLFEPSTRSHYDLEMLWGDAPRVAWEREDQLERDRAGVGAGDGSRGS